MTIDSLSRDLPYPSPSLSHGNVSYGTPVQGKKDTFIIEGEEIGPDMIIGTGEDLTPRERRITLKYLSLRDPVVCWAKGEALPLRPEDGLPAANIHHFKRLPNGKRLHQMKEMALCCHDHNAQAGRPPQVPTWSTSTSEREKLSHAESSIPSSTEMAKSVPMRARWLKWLRDSKEGPFAGVQSVSLDDLCNKAPRKCARVEFGEEFLGTAQSYKRYATHDDMDTAGGPLHLYPRTDAQTGKSEIWVRLSDAERKLLDIPNIEPEQEI